MSREIIRASLNEEEQEAWNKLKALLGFSEDSKAIKFATSALLWEWEHWNESVPRWFLERKLQLMKFNYKPSKKKIVTREMTKHGLVEQKKEVYATPNRDICNTNGKEAPKKNN